MDKKLEEYLNGNIGSYVIPSYWLHGKDSRTEDILKKLREIYDDGARSVCIESRPHPSFAQKEWWEDMDLIMAEAHKCGMDVWLMDDIHYPSGRAGGAMKLHPELRAWNVAENHLDVIGPVKDGAVLLNSFTSDDVLLGVYAYRRLEQNEDMLTGEPIDLSDRVKDGFVYVDLPRGVYRIFMIFKTRKAIFDEFVDVMNMDSVRLMIDAVYQPHYERYRQYVGNTFKGFFSDEPRYKNRAIGTLKQFTSYYNLNIGTAGMALPYSDEALEMINAELDSEYSVKYFPALWYRIEGKTEDVRNAFMNTVSRLYSKCFSSQLGDWCREHGLEYIGHVVEDMDNHARVGNGTAHFFRAMHGQDMSGMDIVLHQVLPGFAHYDNRTHGGVQYADSAFYHYVLAQMCASAAHTDEKKKNRAFAEIYGAYGWAAGLPLMKWIADFVTVRGINRYLIMAYNDTFPDSDCPPHFGAGGQDPQHACLKKLFDYVNKTAHLLSEGTHIANAAILYHAEAEWMNPDGYMKMSVPARELYDAHICYDILCTDTLIESARVEDGRICVGDECFDVLVVPYARLLPSSAVNALGRLFESGADICFVGGVPEGCDTFGSAVGLSELVGYLRERGAYDITVSDGNELLRHYHLKRGATDIFFFFNESVSDILSADVLLPCKTDDVVSISVMENKIRRINAEQQRISLRLEPYESVIIAVGGGISIECDCEELQQIRTDDLEYDLYVADCEAMTKFRLLERTAELFNVTGIDRLPNFSGRLRYDTRISLEESGDYVLELGEVGETAELTVNGVDCGARICKPYRFELDGVMKNGENDISITVSNTLVHKMRDTLSASLLISASGLMGPVSLWKKIKK